MVQQPRSELEFTTRCDYGTTPIAPLQAGTDDVKLRKGELTAAQWSEECRAAGLA